MFGNGTIPGSGRRPDRRAAFLALITEAEAPLRGFIRQKVGPARSVADDILQKTFLNAWSYAGFDPSRPDARSFLFTTAANLVVDWLRSDETRSVSLDELSERGSLAASTVDPNARDPLARIIAEETREALYAALARLNADHHEVLRRFYIAREGTQFQIARSMGLSVAAFNSRLNRARVELKRVLLAARRGRGDGTR